MLHICGTPSLTLVLSLLITSSTSQNSPIFYGQLCTSDLNVETREAAADVVISGRVKALHKTSDDDSAFYSSTISIYRVIKGIHLVNAILKQPFSSRNFYSKTIEIYGFGNPMICDSDIQHSDARIILTSFINSTLHLNSSLVRMGFRTLRPRKYQSGE